jgi:hypothetical protein
MQEYVAMQARRQMEMAEQQITHHTALLEAMCTVQTAEEGASIALGDFFTAGVAVLDTASAPDAIDQLSIQNEYLRVALANRIAAYAALREVEMRGIQQGIEAARVTLEQLKAATGPGE